MFLQGLSECPKGFFLCHEFYQLTCHLIESLLLIFARFSARKNIQHGLSYVNWVMFIWVIVIVQVIVKLPL